ncbi:MAG: hypothetical protein H7Y11_15380, partial [Armatimonadetes bacterium]|nr:hypothetical protein [Anaerolineae bacterium]
MRNLMPKRVMRLSLVLFVFLLSQSIAQSQADLAPYIYYYGRLDGSFIIERADGTDSRIFNDLVPKEHNSVIMRGWSSSGRWFMISSYHSTGEGINYSQQTQVVSTDGQQRIDFGTQSRS